MGLFWDLIQQGQIGHQSARADSIESRIASLEQELHQTRQLLQSLLQRLETHFGKDFDDDGKVG